MKNLKNRNTIILFFVRYYHINNTHVPIYMKHTFLQHTLRLVLAVLLCLEATLAMGQKQKIKNLPYYDQRLLHWGFSLGIDLPDVTFTHTGAENGEGWWATCPQVNPSFIVGLMGDLAITEHLNFRMTPMLLFQERQVTFGRTVDDMGREEITQALKTTYIEIPASLKISTRRINNYRPYLVAGAQLDMDMSHEKETPIVFKHMDIGIHIGLGCDFYLPFFKLAPELRFHMGLLDMIDHEREGLQDQTMMPYTNAIQTARNTGMSLILWFE